MSRPAGRRPHNTFLNVQKEEVGEIGETAKQADRVSMTEALCGIRTKMNVTKVSNWTKMHEKNRRLQAMRVVTNGRIHKRETCLGKPNYLLDPLQQ